MGSDFTLNGHHLDLTIQFSLGLPIFLAKRAKSYLGN
jgi:hypothetical protein